MRFSGWTVPDGARTRPYTHTHTYAQQYSQQRTHTELRQSDYPEAPLPLTVCVSAERMKGCVCACERAKDGRCGGGKKGREDTDSILMAAGWKQF